MKLGRRYKAVNREGDQTCFNVKVVTKGDGSAHIFGIRGSSGAHGTAGCESRVSETGCYLPYENNEEYDSECCLPEDDDEIVVNCAFAGYWMGGYLEINGVQYCRYSDGSFETVHNISNPPPGINFVHLERI